jgi:3-hydroxypropanoate dehydrogenase
MSTDALARPLATSRRIDEAAIRQLFLDARTHNAFLDAPVPDALLQEAVDLAKLGPTAANSSPLRIVFVRSAEAKERLRPALAPGNLDKTIAAPVTAIIAADRAFYDQLPKLFPHADARAWFAGNDAFADETGFRNSSLQGAYFILALRAVGLDAGPMSGFDNAKLDAEFFPDGQFRSNFLINIGFGDHSKLFPRSPRLTFSEIATFA